MVLIKKVLAILRIERVGGGRIEDDYFRHCQPALAHVGIVRLEK
jgi:hypothetical protein